MTKENDKETRGNVNDSQYDDGLFNAVIYAHFGAATHIYIGTHI